MATTIDSKDILLVKGIETIGGGIIEKGTDSEGTYYKLYDNSILRLNEPSGVKKLVASMHYSGNGVMTVNNDVITFGRKSGASLCSLFDGAPTTDGTYVSGFVVQRPAGETGELVDFDMWTHGGCALYDSGNFYTAGYNVQGGLGIGSTTSQAMLTLSSTNVVDYRRPENMSYDHSYWRLFIKKIDGYWYGAGNNTYGALGIGSATAIISTWTPLTSAGTTVRELWNLGTSYGCVVIQKEDGSVWVAGYNGNGQLGNNLITSTNVLINVSSAWNVMSTDIVLKATGEFGHYDTAAASGSSLLMLISSNGIDGFIKSSGINSWGNLGDGTTTQRQIPIFPLGVPSNVKSLMVHGGGPASCYALTTDNRLFVWGYNNYGQLGVGDLLNKATPIEVSTVVGDTITDIFADAHSQTYSYVTQSFYQTASGKLYGAGKNSQGQLGMGHVTDVVNAYTLIPFDTEKYGRVINIKWNGVVANNTTGNNYSLTLLTDHGRVFVTGLNTTQIISIDGQAINKSTWTLLDFSQMTARRGDQGRVATISVGTTVAGVDPDDASVTNSGTPQDAVFNFVLPSGQAATIAVGDVITSELAPSVINSGTEKDAIFDFNLPKGDKGDTGDTTGVARGSSTFMGDSTVRTIAHGLGFVPSFVYIMQSQNPAGYLGETWYTTDNTNLYIYNTGSATTSFVWMAF